MKDELDWDPMCRAQAQHDDDWQISWSSLPHHILTSIIQHFQKLKADTDSLKLLRLVNCHWYSTVNLCIQSIASPRDCPILEVISTVYWKLPNVLGLDVMNGMVKSMQDYGSLAYLTRLRSLKLGVDSVENCVLWYLTSLTNLTLLRVRDCLKVDNSAYVHLKPLKNLRDLCLVGVAHLKSDGMEFLTSLTKLTSLMILGAPCATEHGLKNLICLANLERLYLPWFVGVSDDGLKSINQVSNLRELDLQGCVMLTNSGMTNLNSLKSLSVLNVKGCPMVNKRDWATGLVNLRSLHMNRRSWPLD